MDFEWNADKAEKNIEKHKVRFEIATKVFLDADRVEVVDGRRDYEETRMITYGRIDNRLYVVVFTEDEDRDVVRIISARKANARERKQHDNS